jgi:hypothetical protein
MEHIHQFCLHPIFFIPPPTFAHEQHLNFKFQITVETFNGLRKAVTFVPF